ncbi:hypothetical protein JCM10914A_21460 [Paenibacillus sp. JCM 10914]|uniref:PdaC/SigV domain-containing protein n=1 Tax=Paenibacillus sp. JCM 10914 TaxID=1236974 RepID=UPI0003CC73D8|nr:DUF4163 domain-containing protein [Paenibacillus sp. JCM 10914]GAE08687.1 hypothetical protein JCM10914_5004 [Paenibacillus sp. JCM 10914]
MNTKFRVCATVIATGVLLGSLGMSGPAIDASATKPSVSTSQQAKNKNEVTLYWKGKALPQKGLVHHGITYIPATALRDHLGMPLKYDAKNKTYNIGNGYNKLSAVVYDASEIGILVNGSYVGEPGGQIIKGRLYLPYAAVSQYLGIQGQWSGSAKTLSLSEKKLNNITIKSVPLEKKIQGVESIVNYPVISGLDHAAAQAEINKVLKENAEGTMDIIEQGAGAFPEDPIIPYEFSGDFVVQYNQNDTLSIMTYNYSYTGGAHGMTFRNSYTFSLKDGKQMKLGDFINMQGENKQKLNNHVLTTMKKDGGYLGGFEGVPSDAEFYVKDNAAVLYFQLYEYTAYAFGFPEFELKLKDWK